MARYRFTSESVTEGHPDKLCDQVSDAILDAILTEDPRARVACESLAKTGMVVVAGEITTTARLDYAKIVRETVKEIGYVDSAMGFDGATCAVLSHGDRAAEPGHRAAGRQRGRRGSTRSRARATRGPCSATRRTGETPELMPAPIQYAHTVARQLAVVRKKKLGGVDFLRPDGKTQITLEYEDGAPLRIDAICVSEHAARRAREVPSSCAEAVIDPRHRQVAAEEAHRQEDQDPGQPHRPLRHRRPSGRLRPHGPQDHRRQLRRAGSARRLARSSGKDPSKVDRSACYYARYVAKNGGRVGRRQAMRGAGGLHAIGVAQPVGVRSTRWPARVKGERRGPREVRAGPLRHATQGAHRDARSAAPHLQADRGMRSRRPCRVSLGRRRTARPRSGPTCSVARAWRRPRTASNGHAAKKPAGKKTKRSVVAEA